MPSIPFTKSLNLAPLISEKGRVETTLTVLLPGKLYSSCASLGGTVNVTMP